MYDRVHILESRFINILQGEVRVREREGRGWGILQGGSLQRGILQGGILQRGLITRGYITRGLITLEQYTLREQRPHFIMDVSPRAFFLL